MEIKKFEIVGTIFNELHNYITLTPDVEVCGIIKGIKNKDGSIVLGNEIIKIKNISDYKKEVDYVMNPNELMNALKDTTFINKNNNKEWVCIFHSHPSGIPIPSSIDLDRAEYNVVYYIGGLKTKKFDSVDMSYKSYNDACYWYDKKNDIFKEITMEVV